MKAEDIKPQVFATNITPHATSTSLTPRSMAAKSDGFVADQGITYNQAGLSYNEIGIVYGGFYGNSTTAPLLSFAALIRPTLVSIQDVPQVYAASSYLLDEGGDYLLDEAGRFLFDETI